MGKKPAIVIATALAAIMAGRVGASDTLYHEPSLAKAKEDLDHTIAQLGSDSDRSPDVFIQKAHLLARTGRWEEAAADLTKALQMDPWDAWAGYFLSSALLQSGKLAEYQKHSHAMMVRFGDNWNSMIGGLASEAYLVAPYGDMTDLEMSVKLTRRKVFPWWRQFYQGLAEYRLGHYSKAVGLLEKDISELGSVNAVDHPPCEANCFLVLAMARHQLNQTQETSAALAHGREVLENQIPRLDAPDLGPFWWNGVTTRALMKEAQETVEESGVNPVNARPSSRTVASLTFSYSGGTAGDKEIIPVSGPFSQPPSGSLRILPESVTVNGGQFQFAVAGVTPGTTVYVQASGELFTPDSWVAISTNLASSTTLSVSGINAMDFKYQFFRVIETK